MAALFQLIHALALETAYPSYTAVKLPMQTLAMNYKAITSIKYGMPRGSCRVVMGSRAEGLAIEPGWGYPHPDTDTMIIYGGEWTAHSTYRRFLGLNNTQCFPGFYRLEFTKASFERTGYRRFIKRCSRGILVGVPYWFRVLLLLSLCIYLELISFCDAIIACLFLWTCVLVDPPIDPIAELYHSCPDLPLPKCLSRILLAIPTLFHRLRNNLRWCKKHFHFKGLYHRGRHLICSAMPSQSIVFVHLLHTMRVDQLTRI